MENAKHFVFDLTCDVTGDLEVKFLNFIWKISFRPFHCHLNFSPTSVGFRDRWGADTPSPPLQPRVGSGLGPAGRGLIHPSTLYHIKFRLDRLEPETGDCRGALHHDQQKQFRKAQERGCWDFGSSWVPTAIENGGGRKRCLTRSPNQAAAGSASSPPCPGPRWPRPERLTHNVKPSGGRRSH